MKSKKALLNVIANSIAQVLNVVLAFACRKVFLLTLGSEILGLNSLFSSILAFLTLTELGIGVSISMCLYKPLAEDNKAQICAYMSFLKKVYRFIGWAIIVGGILLIPFLKYIVNGNYQQRYIVQSFILYVLSTAVTYFFSYKKVLLGADQKSYIVSASQIFYKIVLNVGQIVVLLTTRNYYLFLIITIVCNVLENIVVSKICDKQYPYLAKLQETLDKSSKKDLYKKLKGMLCYKLSNYLIEGTDNIIISFFMGTVFVTYFSNYYLVINMLFAIFACFGTSAIAGLGNILYSDKKHLKTAFSKLLMVQHLVYSFSATALLVLLSEFVRMFFGLDSVLSMSVVVLMVCIYYVKGYSQGLEAVRNCAGLYEKDKYLNLVIAILNVVMSSVLINVIGIAGVLIGTLVCYLIKELIIVPQIVFKEILPKMKQWYYKQFVLHLGITCIIVIASIWINKVIHVSNEYIDWFIGGIICFVISLLVNILLLGRTQEMKAIKQIVVNMIKRR